MNGLVYPNQSPSSLLYAATLANVWIEGALSTAADLVNKSVMTSYALSLGSMNELNFGALKIH